MIVRLARVRPAPKLLATLSLAVALATAFLLIGAFGWYRPAAAGPAAAPAPEQTMDGGRVSFRVVPATPTAGPTGPPITRPPAPGPTGGLPVTGPDGGAGWLAVVGGGLIAAGLLMISALIVLRRPPRRT